MFLNVEVISLLLILSIATEGQRVPTVDQLAEVARDIYSEEDIVQMCDTTNTNNSFIYCYGNLLAAVNVHKLFSDSKYFVDMPMKQSPNDTINAFSDQFGAQMVENINASQLREFVDEYFSHPGTELEPCELDDWQPNPPRLMRIQDPVLRAWALKLNGIWKDLCRRIKPMAHPDQHSLISVPEPFIVPGGRFREYYYWDAYWIIKGLIACGMNSTVRNMIINLVSCVERFGFVPNGGRVYYLARSQPPMLIPMAYEYYEMTHNSDFIAKILPALVKEYEFWYYNRSINATGADGNTYRVYQYRVKSTVPRPESFRPDLIHAFPIPLERRQKYYQDTASAAESGWDFSSRWFADRMSIETIETTNILPVDLNAFICYNLDILSYLFRQTGNLTQARYYREKKLEHRYAMQQVFFDPMSGTWFDYNLRRHAFNTNFYPASAVPLFAECYQPLSITEPERTIEYINNSGAFDYRGGVPTSLVDSGQQWDFPNGWAPLNHMIVEGLRKSINPYAQEEAFQIAQKWIHDNYFVFDATGFMWEKYNVTGQVPSTGAGGEYNVQEGFGWTNGAALDLLTTYYDRLTAAPNTDTAKRSSKIAQPALIALIILSLPLLNSIFNA